MKFSLPAFSLGEVSPDLFGRVDLNSYTLGLKTARNMVIHTYGGASNRAGTIFVGSVYDHTRYARLIPFQFKTTDRHVIELGHEYIRFLRNDAHIIETPFTITGATQADPVEITTSGAHGFSTNDEVFLSAVGGMTEITEAVWKIVVTGATTFTLADQVTGADVDGLGFTAYTSGGTAARLYKIASPYQEEDLRTIKYTQTADVVTLVHPKYPHSELRRLGLTNWQLVEITYTPEQDPPSSVAITVRTTGTTTAKYKVTATSDDEEESLPGISTRTPVVITAATQANPCVITAAGHGLNDGDEIKITGVVGMTELNNRRYRVTFLGASTFELRDVDSTGFTAYVSGGSITFPFATVTNSHANYLNDVTWAAVAGARSYSVYREQNGIYGLIGETEALKFVDDATSIKVNLSETPPQERNPFFGAGNYPGAVGTYEQRRVLGGSLNKPDTSFYSRIGLFRNFTVTIPTQDDDAITAVLTSREVNEIRHIIGLNDLIVFTSGAEWIVNGSLDAGFTPSSIRQNFQSNWGSAHVPPILVGSTVLFVLENGSGVRSLVYNAESVQAVSYVSRNVGLLVPHLFRTARIEEWSYGRAPEPLTYVVLSDGRVLALTYDEEQKVVAWARWDTFGVYESVAVSRPTSTSKEEVPYFIIRRRVNGQEVRYIERSHSRVFTDVRDAFFVDSGLTHDVPFNIEDITLSNPVKITITDHPFVNGDHVDIFDIVWVSSFDAVGNETQPDQLNRRRFVVAGATANTFELTSIEDGSDIDGTAFAGYVGGGTARLAVQTLSGLRHLVNEAVTILADGNVLSKQVVQPHGVLVLPRRFSRIHVGLSYISDLETLNIEIPTGTIQGEMKKVSDVNVRFERSRGLLIGPDSYNLVEMKQREFELIGDPTELLSGDKLINLLPQWNTNGRLFLRQKDPLPMTILSLTPDIHTEGNQGQ